MDTALHMISIKLLPLILISQHHIVDEIELILVPTNCLLLILAIIFLLFIKYIITQVSELLILLILKGI